MSVTLTSSEGLLEPNRPFVKGDGRYDLRDVLGSPYSRDEAPQVFLVEQQGTTPPHFHTVPQFQVFVRGAGTFGRSRVTGPVVHYVDAYTTYGPIVAAPDGAIWYFTARVAADLSSHVMPGAKHEKLQRSGRRYTIELGGVAEDRLATGSEGTWLIDPHEDGLAAFEVYCAPGGTLELPPDAPGGRLLMVLDGALFVDGTEYPALSWGHQVSTGSDGAVRSGANGARVLGLDYPSPRAVVPSSGPAS